MQIQIIRVNFSKNKSMEMEVNILAFWHLRHRDKAKVSLILVDIKMMKKKMMKIGRKKAESLVKVNLNECEGKAKAAEQESL